jgi:UDP-N-acetyl-2-amino-2-deoxyglucuronate dehydrogenase
MTDTTSPPPLQLAIVGCGQIVKHHVAYMDKSSWQIRALCDPNANHRSTIESLCSSELSSLPTKKPVHQYENLKDLLDDAEVMKELDVIFIATPHDLHEPMAMQVLLESSVYVALEKPLSTTYDSCERLVTAAQGRLLITEQSSCWQEVVRAKELIEQGAIGRLVSVASYYYESMRDNVTSGDMDDETCKGGVGGWRGNTKRAGGGIAMDGGLHWIRPLRELCGGRITKVVGVVRRGLVPELKMDGGESVGHALLEIETAENSNQQQPIEAGPLIATYSCNMLATAPMAHDACPYFRITGDQGEMVIHGDGLLQKPGAGGLRLYNNEYPDGHELFLKDRQGGFFSGFAGLWEDIFRIVTTKDAAAADESVVKAADDVKVVLALYRSSESKLWEDVDIEG